MQNARSPRTPLAALTLAAAVAATQAGCGIASVASATATVAGQTVKTGATVVGTAGRGAVKGTRAAGRLVTRPFRDGEPKDTAPSGPQG